MKKAIRSNTQKKSNDNWDKFTAAVGVLNAILKGMDAGTLDEADSRLDYAANYLDSTLIPELLDSIDAHGDDSPIDLF